MFAIEFNIVELNIEVSFVLLISPVNITMLISCIDTMLNLPVDTIMQISTVKSKMLSAQQCCHHWQRCIAGELSIVT